MNPLDSIARAMGMLLHFIYNNISFGSYGLAIIIFTFIIKAVLLPLTIKQYKSTARMQELQPQIQEVQRRYKNDKDKLNQELMKVYTDNKVNPTGGCLPLLVQMPILFSLYWVISQPLKFMLGKSTDVINQLLQAINGDLINSGHATASSPDLTIIRFFTENPDKLANVEGLLKKEELLNMNFLGLNLGLQPSFSYNPELGWQYFGLLLIPVLAGLTTYISVKYSTAKTTQQSTDNQMANQMTNSMTTIMPFMTAFFAFSVPAGLGLYWITSNVIQVLQQAYLNRFVLKKKEVATK